MSRRAADSSMQEEGTVVVLVVGLALAMLAVAGLVYDGGAILAARRDAFDVAANAARAGAQAVDLDTVRTGDSAELDVAAAATAAHAWLKRSGDTGAVTVDGHTVQVTVTREVRLVLLSLAGMDRRNVTGIGTATITRGVGGPEG